MLHGGNSCSQCVTYSVQTQRWCLFVDSINNRTEVPWTENPEGTMETPRLLEPSSNATHDRKSFLVLLNNCTISIRISHFVYPDLSLLAWPYCSQSAPYHLFGFQSLILEFLQYLVNQIIHYNSWTFSNYHFGSLFIWYDVSQPIPQLSDLAR